MTDAQDIERGLARLVRQVTDRRLPGVSRAAQAEGPALMVADSPFATMLDATTVALACPADQKVLLMDISPDLYFETEAFIGRNLVLLRLDRVDDEELSLRLHDAWEYVAPSTLRKYVD